MKSRGLNYRLIIFVIATVFGIFFSLPTFKPSTALEGEVMDGRVLTLSQTGVVTNERKLTFLERVSLSIDKAPKVAMGLDLQGGLYMLLGVQTDEAIGSKIKSIASGIKYHTDSNGIMISSFKIDNDKITLELLDPSKENDLDNFIKETKGTVINKQGFNYAVTIDDSEKANVKSLAVLQAVETIRNRLDQFGLAEPTVAKQGEDQILVEIPGIKTQEEEQRARELIAKAAHLQLMAVDEDRNDRANFISREEAALYGDVILSDYRDPHKRYLVKVIPILDGSMLTDAGVAFDQNNRPMITFSLDSQGARIFGDFTGKNKGKRLAVVLDNVVYSAPNIIDRIGGGNGQITGAFTIDEANDVAIALRSGALLAPVTMLEKRSVGPSLGADSVKASLIALISGFAAVVIFMCFYYRVAGVIACVALASNLIILIGLIALFGATLTLPGMAGIILTVGMGIDANVIINERIRELLRMGSSVRNAIEKGYQNAFTAILDSNLTTVIVALVLYAYGTGPVKGFAITLSFGVFISMLTAILGTRGVYEAIMDKIEKSKNLTLWFGMEKKGSYGDI
ncbi:MAG: protein translocase subunit SecD [Campylobacteraceae bacterium]|jgi:preprotein translocase subunit SecD|nr:protein translocase subunit SecD [Campylobacteraceae bacterium]